MLTQISESALPVCPSAEKEVGAIGKPSIKKIITIKSLVYFFRKFNPANWYNDFAEIPVTLDE